MNLKTTLDTIDRSLTSHRQQIALHQVEIARLEDARRVLIGLGEEASPEMQRAIALKAEAGSPLLIVREPGSANHSEVLDAKAHKKALASAAYQRRKARLQAYERTPERRNYKREYERRRAEEKRRIAAEYGAGTPAFEPERKERPKNRIGSQREHYHEAVKRIFLERPATPLMTKEVRDLMFPNRVPGKKETQYVHQTLYDLKKQGFIRQAQQGEPYSLVREAAS